MVARTARFPDGPATRAAAGRATRSWSTPSTSSARRAFPARPPTHSWWNASRGSTRKRSDYQFTVTDPTAYTRPWTAVEPLRAIDEPLFEYACHEGNYGMKGILAGARVKDKEQATKP